ncbi:MAG: pirin family protein [Kineosporiaceae bacterium]
MACRWRRTPHTGLQTVSWLVQGEILHRDSLGSVQLVEPGQLNLMTAGRGISHSEQTPAEHGPLLHGVQLWVALPDASRGTEPAFEHRADLPRLSLPGVGDSAAEVVVIMGEVAGHASRAAVHSPLVAAEVSVRGTVDLPLSPEFEHALLVLDGEIDVSAGEDGADAATALAPGPLLYLGGSRPGVRVRSEPGQLARLLLIGGTPLGEDLVMWWNFVGRSHEEIVTAREDWQAGRGFGEVVGYPGERLPAPALPGVRLRPRPPSS